MTDSIPLHEIDDVVLMDDNSEQSPNLSSSKLSSLIKRENPSDFIVPSLFDSQRVDRSQATTSNSHATGGEGAHLEFLAQSRLSNLLQIKTLSEGVNSGRTYYITTRSSPDAADSRQSLVKQLSAHARIARRKAEAKSRFQRSQDKVKAVQSSRLFQLSMAALIIAVSRQANTAPAHHFATSASGTVWYRCNWN